MNRCRKEEEGGKGRGERRWAFEGGITLWQESEACGWSETWKEVSRGKGWQVISRKEQGEAFTRPQGDQSVPSCVSDTSPVAVSP